jgi:hypothetical protein
LRIVKAQVERCDLLVGSTGRRRERVTKPRHRLRIAISVAANQVFGLLLEMIDIGSIG